MRAPVEERFWAKVDKSAGPGGCWPWLAYRTDKGYGRFAFVHGDMRAPHRFAYELLVGPIPKGLVLDHLCRNRGCCNPAHLEPVTTGENTRRGVWPRSLLTHCSHGHEYTLENTWRDKLTRRHCRACGRERARERYRAKYNADPTRYRVAS